MSLGWFGWFGWFGWLGWLGGVALLRETDQNGPRSVTVWWSDLLGLAWLQLGKPGGTGRVALCG